MNNKSFSLQFNPLMNVKCVKDYEEEIAKLKSENFELKAQITHENIPKVLYENKQEMDAIIAQKQELQKAYENLNATFQNLQQEKKLLENKYSQEMLLAEEKNGFIEDENKRILLRLEKQNRELQDTMGMRNEVHSLREAIQNHERQTEQQRYFYEKEIEELKGQLEAFKREAEEQISKKDFELESLHKKYEQTVQKERNNSFIITDLKATVNSQMKDKNMIEDLLNRNQKLEVSIKEKEETLEKARKEQKAYYNGMDKFKSIITRKMNEISSELQETGERFLKLKAFCHISDENSRLLAKLNVKYANFNEIIMFFKDKHAEAHKKIEVLKKEAADAVFFASNTKNTVEKKTAGFLQEFRDQFNEAKNELLICRKYLEKKAQENKMLKTENGRLLNEAMLRTKQLEAVKKFTIV